MGTSQETVGVVRQPLFNAQRQVLGYEIRSEGPVDEASLAALSGGRPAWVQVTRDVLLSGSIAGQTDGATVVELPENIDTAPEVRDACADLRRRGFAIALNRYSPDAEVAALMPYVDFITAEVPHVHAALSRTLPTIRPRRPAPVTAVGVDSLAQFDDARQAGCVSFQGEFITRPKLTATSNIPAARVTWLRLMQALQDPDLSVMKLEELIKPDAALCLRVMRAVNGAAYAQTTTITSLRQALLLVGVGTVREWATMWTLSQLRQTAPSELVVMASVRGRFCELLSKGSIASTGGDGFLLGMCSLLDAILESPMEAVLKHLPLCESNAAALRGESNGQRALLDAAIAYEHGQWERSRKLAAGAGIDATLLPVSYQGAISWMARFQEPAAA